MLALSSIRDAIERLAHARCIDVQAYTLGGSMLAALSDAARCGARVSVRLESHPYGDEAGRLGRRNAALARQLRAAGADARTADPIHGKTLTVDGTLFLDGKNWREGDIVLRDEDANDPVVARDKRAALALEASLLQGARQADHAIVESESFGFCTPVYSALDALGRLGEVRVGRRPRVAGQRECDLRARRVRCAGLGR